VIEFITQISWIAVLEIIAIDILLGGDNAVVIALACRNLPPAQRKMGIIWGTVGAIVLRVVLIFFALSLLKLPGLKLVGAVLLLWIGLKLLAAHDEEGHGELSGSDKLWGAVKTVIIADFVMSLDNVIAIAGAAGSAPAGQQLPLVIFGLLVSIPIIVWGSQLVIKLMDRYPVIITAGGMLLGWIAGSMAVGDPLLADPDVVASFPKLPQSETLRYAAGIAGALFVLVVGKWLEARRRPPAVAAAPAVEPAAAGRLRRILLAVDGSEPALHAVRYVLGLRQSIREGSALEVQLINVQRPVSGDVSSFVAKDQLQEFQNDRCDAALASARQLLDQAGQAYQEHRKVGPPGPTIAEVAQAQGCDLVVMGARGLGTHTAALLGSVTQSAIEHSGVPVLVVK
jgi:YjbE family integral membrane protein